jgi:hypothetical protein
MATVAQKKRRVNRSLKRARSSMKKRGTLGSYGHHTESEDRANIRKGGAIGKKAQFALNMKRMASRRKKRSHKRTSRR